MKNILSIIVALLTFSSCEEKPRTIIDPAQNYAFINNSGVKIAIVPKGEYSNLPDSLVLENGKMYSWGLFKGLPISPRALDPLKIYFNETNVILYGDTFDPDSHDPREPSYYKNSTLPNGIEVDVYTFTVEDYQRALEQDNTEK